MVTVSRIGGSWNSNAERKMTFLEMIHWMNKHHYTVRWSRKCSDGILRLHYSKADCNTEYYVNIAL
jgi:hypothetical protein